MATLGKNEKKMWADNLYIYEAASDVLASKIKLVKMEYDRIYRPRGYCDIQKITSRIKKVESVASKLEKDGYTFTNDNIIDHIHDVVGHRVVCLTLNDLTLFADLLSKSICNTQGFDLLGYKDFINNPKESGYRSLHLRLGVPVTFSNEHHDVTCEVQLRTTNMDSFAQLEHHSGYKPVCGVPDFLTKQLISLSAMGNGVDTSVSSIMLPSGDVLSYNDVIANIKKMTIESNPNEKHEESNTGILVKKKIKK